MASNDIIEAVDKLTDSNNAMLGEVMQNIGKINENSTDNELNKQRILSLEQNKVVSVKPWVDGETVTDINQGRRYTDSKVYLPKAVPVIMRAAGPDDDNWQVYTPTYLENLATSLGINRDQLGYWSAGEVITSAAQYRVKNDIAYQALSASIQNPVTCGVAPGANFTTFKAISADSVAQSIVDQNGKDWFIDEGFLVVPQSSAFTVKAGAGYVSGNRIQLDYDRIINAVAKPSFIYVETRLKGPVAEFDIVVSVDEKDDYTDPQGVKFFVCKIAQVLADGSVKDLRPRSKPEERLIKEVTGRQSILGRQLSVYTDEHEWPVVNGETNLWVDDRYLLTMSSPPTPGSRITGIDLPKMEVTFDNGEKSPLSGNFAIAPSVSALASLDVPMFTTGKTKYHADKEGGGGAEYTLWPAPCVKREYIDVTHCSGAVWRFAGKHITAAQMGFAGESLYDTTHEYKGKTYQVKKWTTDQDIKPAVESFLDSDLTKLDLEDHFVYLSNVIVMPWTGKRITGTGRHCCGFVYGSFNFADGTKSAEIDGVGFWGTFGYIPLPLPATTDPDLKDDPNYFWVPDNIAKWGYGMGALTVAGVSEDGNTDDVRVHNCHFEMRNAVISGGSTPDDADNPKATGVRFYDNTTRNIIYHGFAGINFKGARAFDNHFEEHYNGYAADLSTGCVGCHVYSNTGEKLASAFKAESNARLSGNMLNNIHDNEFIVDGTFGAAYTMLCRFNTASTRAYDNRFTLRDVAGDKSGAVIHFHGANSIFTSNRIVIEGTPRFKNLVSVINNRDSGVQQQSFSFHDNRVYNHTQVSLDALFMGSDTPNPNHIIEAFMEDNYFWGKWDTLCGVAHMTEDDIIDHIKLKNNDWPGTTLFKPYPGNNGGQLGDLEVEGGFTQPAQSASIVSLSTLTKVTGNVSIKDVKSRSGQGGTSFVNLVSCTTEGTDLTECDIFIDGVQVQKIEGAIVFLSGPGGVDIPCKSVIIGGGSTFIFEGTLTFSDQIRARKAETFVMSQCTLINRFKHQGVNIYRPADGPKSKYQYCTEIGVINDFPLEMAA